ncbi:RNA polymerase III transcription factor IIIC subunit-domain-containing protein [Phascolomyces articulosus]|uniref:RNA polymerase III transcription factor IIIC subunit-domain-containing protein n=1 Tax=Phascolomyces articulosus TaxID=60185 RepID=A0AAD5K051_9FUNG|nr:RNA polymerase III transcription factor IIIC subunit-domain-containing protein [Phascolomyces articulosus]
MDQTFNLTIPNRKFILVEYPGRVKNVDRALKTLGGEKAIVNLLDKDVKTIELRQRPEDPFCHPIAGDVLPSSSLLLKVTKRKKKNQPDEEATFKTEALGTISKTCRFRAMADFQYIVPKDNKLRQLRQSLEEGRVNDILNFQIDEDKSTMVQIPPPIFSMRETPFDYNYNQNQPIMRVRVRQRDGSYAIRLVHRFKRPALEIASIKFEEAKVPEGPQFDTDLLKTEEQTLADELKKLFEERVIWTRVGILNHVEASRQRYLRGALNTVAYTFRTGPWRECWIKYGIDPRIDKKYHIYQHLGIRGLFDFMDARVPTGTRKGFNRVVKQSIANAKKEITANREENVNLIFDGKNAPPKSAVICLVDVTDPDFQVLLNSPKYLKSVCTKDSGFYYACVLDRLRNMIKKKMLEWKSTGKMSHLPSITKGLDQAIAKEIESKKYDESMGFVDRGDHNEEGGERDNYYPHERRSDDKGKGKSTRTKSKEESVKAIAVLNFLYI